MIVLSEPFVKRELKPVAFLLDDRTIVQMPSQHLKMLKNICLIHARETTQPVFTMDNFRNLGSRIMYVEALTIWLPSAIPDFETRLSWTLFSFPKIDLVRNNA